MKGTLVVFAATTFLAGCGGISAFTHLSDPSQPLRSHRAKVCVLPGMLPEEFKYTEVGKVTASRSRRDTSEALRLAVVNEARRVGADVVLNLDENAQAWDVVRPTTKAIAVRLTPDSPRLECEKLGGKLL